MGRNITQRDVSPAVWSALQAAAGSPPAPKAANGKRHAGELVAAAHEHGTRDGVPYAWWVIPVEVPSLANDREWRTRNRVAQTHRRAVSRALGPHLRALAPFAEHLHDGGRLRITVTRLGGRKLDAFDNLPASVKYVLDGLCLALGVDDSDSRLLVVPEQQPGGPVGVRVELQPGPVSGAFAGATFDASNAE